MRAQVAREDLNDSDRLQFEFALGKALEDAGDFADSFAHYARGNALRRAAILYDPDDEHAPGETNGAALHEGILRRARGLRLPGAAIRFLSSGLPRAGSTLLEQILASHSQVEGTRELPDIPGFALELGALEVPGQPPAYPQSVARLSNAELTALGERYLAQTRPNRLLGRPRFIDKMPRQLFSRGSHPSDPAQCAHHRRAALAARLLLRELQAAFSIGRVVHLQPRGPRPLLSRLRARDERTLTRCCPGAFIASTTRTWSRIWKARCVDCSNIAGCRSKSSVCASTKPGARCKPQAPSRCAGRSTPIASSSGAITSPGSTN